MLIYRLSIKTYYLKETERRSARHNTVAYLCRLCPFTSDPSARGDFCLGLLTTQYYIQQHCTTVRRRSGGSSVTARRGGVRRRALAFIGAQLLQQFYQSYCAVYSGRYIKKTQRFLRRSFTVFKKKQKAKVQNYNSWVKQVKSASKSKVTPKKIQ